MFNKVLVPLDGSELAECALVQVKNLAQQALIGKVTLLSIVEMKLTLADIPLNDLGIGIEFDFPPQLHEELDIYRNYLTRVEYQLRFEGLNVESVVLGGNHPAKNIIDFANENSMDLIVIATHGYRGVKRLLLGSVASKVLHEAHVAVLLIRPEAELYDGVGPGIATENFSGRSLHS